MALHLYFVLSTYTPIILQPNMAVATYDTTKVSSSLLVKLFSRPLIKGEDVTITPSNSGDQGIATLIITKKVVYLKNQSILDLEEKYPQLAKIQELAQILAEQLDLDLPERAPICDFAIKAQQLEGVVIYNIDSSSQ